MPLLSDRTELPDEAKPVADLIEKLGFKWDFDYQHPLPDTSHRVQIREEKHYTPSAMVSRFREALKRGDKFPPIIVTADDYLIDGNTRAAAAARNGWPHLATFILRDRYDGASTGIKRRMHVLGAGANARNGKGIDPSEIRRAVEVIGEDASYDATRIAALIGVTENTVRNFVNEKRARDRAERLGLHVNGSVPASILRTLGTAKLNDQPWKELFRLVQETGMGRDEVTGLLKSLREAGADVKAIDLLREEQLARAEQIADYKARGKAKPPGSAVLRRALGTVLGDDGDVTPLVEFSPALMPKHREMVAQAIAVLQAVLEQQEQRMAAAAAAEQPGAA